MKNDNIGYSKYVLVRIVLILFNEHVFAVFKDIGSSKEKTLTYTSAKFTSRSEIFFENKIVSLLSLADFLKNCVVHVGHSQ